VRSGIGLVPARAPLPPAMALRCATPRLMTYEYPSVIHQQQVLLQAYPCHPIQGTAYVMMTADVVSGLLRAYRATQRVSEPSPCYYALTKAFSVDDLAPGDCSTAEALAEYDAIAQAVPWAAVQERLPYHHDPTRQAPSTKWVSSRTAGATTSASWASRGRRTPRWGSCRRSRGSRLPPRGPCR